MKNAEEIKTELEKHRNLVKDIWYDEKRKNDKLISESIIEALEWVLK